jgi:hypothetical protein
VEQLTTDNLRLFLVFVVPGFVASRVYRLLTPGRAPDAAALLIEVVSYSMLNLGVMFWVPLVLWQDRYFSDSPTLFVTSGLFVLVVAPAGLAVGVAKARRSNWLLKYIGHPAASSWDFHFEKRRACFVLATLKDGAKIGGYWGPRSFASSAPHEADIYLEQTWSIVDGALVAPVVGTAGCHLRASECQFVEFIVAEEYTDAGQGVAGTDGVAADRGEGGLPASCGPAEPGTPQG